MSFGKALLLSGWLPVGIAVTFAVGNFDTGPSGSPSLVVILTFFAMMWAFGVPLAFAVRTLLRYSKSLAWGVGVLGASLSVGMFFLSVPLPSFANAIVPGVLAWLFAGCVALASRLSRMCS